MEWYRKWGFSSFRPRAPPCRPHRLATGPRHVNRTSPPAAPRNCGAERVFAPPAAKKGRKIALFKPLRKRNSVFSRAQKGLFFDLFAPLGARKRALRRNCAARRVETSYLRARAERGAAGASRGRAGAEKRKSRFLGRVGTTLSRMKLYSSVYSSYCTRSRSAIQYKYGTVPTAWARL